MKKTILLLALVLALALSALLFASCELSSGEEEETEATTVPEHEHVWDEGTVLSGGCDPETQEGTPGEIRYTCTICGETKTEETDGHSWEDRGVRAEPTCKITGIRLYVCTVCDKKRGETIPVNPDAHVFKAGDQGRIVKAPTESQDGELEKVCTKCGKGVTTPLAYADYHAQVVALKTEISGFSTSDFGGAKFLKTRQELIDASGRSFSMPPVNPKSGQHPRVLFNAKDRAGINAELLDSRSEVAATTYRSYITNPTDGRLKPAETRSDGFHNFDAIVLNKIQALALEYQLTGNEIAGLQAVKAMLNFLKTMDFQRITGDLERQHGYVMFIAACVYDWCHDLMTSVDRVRLVSGVQHKVLEGNDLAGHARMEIGFPPSGQHAIAGHGCEFQLLRDYLSFAIAIYDEYPGWWEYIAGRIYQEFVPVRNEYYKAGMYPQGVSVYIRIRFSSDLASAWLLKAATGKMPYDEEGMKEVVRTFYCYELPNKNGFQSGDDQTTDGNFIVGGRATLISSYLFDDPTLRAQLEYFGQSYNTFGTAFNFAANVSEYLICSSHGVKAASDRHDDLPLIRYNGGWLGQIIARNSWKNDQAAVLMKIGCRTMANHDHADAGQFQIWYRTMLAGDTGAYDTYGDTHFKEYHQATIAHNCVLVYNSSKASTYYTGGQKQPGETGNQDKWRSDAYKTGTVTGYQYAYADEAETQPLYAYIAGNITPAYYDGTGRTSSDTVNEVTRRMLTVYDTKNADVPMFFFVFDNINAKSASHKKTFLLHVPSNPTISGKTVTVTSGGGKLVLQSVFGGDNITKVGGSGNNYNVNGQQLVPTNNGNDGFWGRVEISPNTGKTTDQLLNVMYVCDASKTPSGVTATGIEASGVKGAVIGKTAAVFVTSATRRSTALTFTATGSGSLTYYVSGVKAGNWTVSVGGNTQTVKATADGGLLVFTAPAGAVTLTPQ